MTGMQQDNAPAPSVFWFNIVPAPALSADVFEPTLRAQIATFALPSRPSLDPALFAHRILRGSADRYVWEIVFQGLDLPTDDQALTDAVFDVVRSALVGLGEIAASSPYVDISPPVPGPGFGRATMDGTGAVSFADDDLPGWEDYVRDSGAAEAGHEIPDDLLAEIARSRAAIPVEPGLKPWGGGHMYPGGSDKSHLAYLHGYLEARAAKASPADRRKIDAFHAFQAREGSTAAINTYDNQILTWGTGWGGLGWLGKVMERAITNEALCDALGAAGVRYRGKNIYDVVSLEDRRVVTGGKEALEVLRHSLPLLYLLIHIARDPATRDAATEAQLRTFMDGSANISGSAAIATPALFNLIAHLKHWAPGYVMGCLEWALPQAGDGPSEERDRRLAPLVGHYFYGQARKFKWIPDWKQFQLYWKHMKADGLDCLADPFILASAPPAADPFATLPAVAPVSVSVPSLGNDAILKNAPLAGQPELASVASGKSALRRGAKGAGVKAVQEALIALGIDVPGGADGAFGPTTEGAIKTLQAKHGLGADGVVGPGTLKAIDASLGSCQSV
jgi:Putative peptidoglycan binding domain